MGFAVLSAASSSARSSFFSASGMVLSALSAAISLFICSGGSVNSLVCGSMPDMIVDTLLGDSLGLRLHLRIRFVWVRALVELHHVVVGANEVLNMLLGELDLL